MGITEKITGVRIILIHNGKFLFQLRDDKSSIAYPNMWSFVGGFIEEGETFEEAICRECEEEIGIIPEDITYIGKSDVSACFYAYLTDNEVSRLVLGEGQEMRFFTPDEMLELKTTPRLRDLLTIQRHALDKFIAKEDVSADDIGLVL